LCISTNYCIIAAVKHFCCIATVGFLCTELALARGGDLVHVLRVPNGGIQPQAVVDSSGTAHLVYLKGDPAGCDVFYARRPPGQTNFSSPIQVNTNAGSAIALGTVRGAQIALGLHDRVHVVWNGAQPARNPGAKGAPLLYSHLDDSSHRFEPERNLMTCTMSLDGGGSVAADRNGNVYAVWHALATDAEPDELHRAVYVARSKDDGRTFEPERRIGPETGGVCGCCGLKAFVGQKGPLEILYRSADELGNRNSMLLVSADHGQTFKTQTLGVWHSSTCPMSTAFLDNGPDNKLAALWETQGQIFREFIDPERLDAAAKPVPADGTNGDRKHPAFALSRPNGFRFLLAWTKGTGWAKGGGLAWECTDLRTGTKNSGELPGVPAWSLVAVVPEIDGSFTIIY
jgi:hypothetical protein